MSAVRPKGTLDDLDVFDKSIRSHFAFYPNKGELWKKARILGISRKTFDEWAQARHWYQGPSKPADRMARRRT
jgi:hypothetical protein